MAVGSYPYREFERQVWQPRTLLEAWQLKMQFAEQAVVVAGGTLLRTQWESGTALMPLHLISLESLPELRRIQQDRQTIRIGSAVTLASCIRDSRTPQLLKMACSHIAAPSVRNMGTIGGNIMSAVGDSLPALLAAGARFVWFDGQRKWTQTAEEWLQVRRAAGAGKEQRLLIEIVLPANGAAAPSTVSFYEKLGRREAFCPSVVTAAGELQLDSEGIVADVRLAAGSAAAMAIRLTAAEALLEGQRLSQQLIHHIHRSVKEQFDGGSDAFASNAYRRQVAANLIAAALWDRIPGGGR